MMYVASRIILQDVEVASGQLTETQQQTLGSVLVGCKTLMTELRKRWTSTARFLAPAKEEPPRGSENDRRGNLKRFGT